MTEGKKRLRLLVRASISFVFLTWLIWTIDIGSFAESVGQVHFATVVLCLFINCIGIWLSVYKWKGFLEVRSKEHSFLNLSRLYMIGMFFNNFLPSSVGGDVVKVSLLCKNFSSSSKLMASIFAERFFGLFALFLIGLFGTFYLTSLKNIVEFPLLLVSVCLALLIFFLWLGNKLSWGRMFISLSLGSFIEKFVGSLREYIHHPYVIMRATWTSIVFQFLVGANYFLVSIDMELNVDFLSIVIFSSLVSLIMILPISINGIGVREGAFVYLLGQIGVGKSSAIALSVTVYAIGLLFSLLGWFFWITWKSSRHHSV